MREFSHHVGESAQDRVVAIPFSKANGMISANRCSLPFGMPLALAKKPLMPADKLQPAAKWRSGRKKWKRCELTFSEESTNSK